MISEDGVVRTPSGICVALVEDSDGAELFTVYSGGVWTSHGVSRFTRDEAVEVGEALVELLNWDGVGV